MTLVKPSDSIFLNPLQKSRLLYYTLSKISHNFFPNFLVQSSLIFLLGKPGIVYEVIDESAAWPFRKERDNMELYFGVKTAQGLLEFKCKNKIHKQKWVDGIQRLLQRTSCIEETEHTLRMLNINKSNQSLLDP